MTFPKDFLWGGAVTAHQSEGAYNAGGKSPAVCDLFPKPEHSDFKDGIDSYHRYDDDFSLFEEMGFTSYRFSIDWSRVCPDGINFSEESMQFYDDFIDSMIRHGMEPMCSLYHFEMPQLLMNKYNGFYSREVVDMFVTYANKMIDRYGDRVKKWISFNEQNAIALPGSSKVAYGAVCPKDIDEQTFINQLVHNTFVAHAKVVEKVHTIADAKVLGMVIYIPAYAATCNPLDELESRNQMALTDMYFDMFTYGEYSSYMMAKMKNENNLPKMLDGDLELLKKNKVDWLSLSYYFSTVASHGKLSIEMNGNAKAATNPYLKASEWGWQIDPLGLRIGLRDIYAKYRLPIMVVENGFGMRDILENETVIDDTRIDYMKDHLEQIALAINEGVDCRGYLMWGPIDILSSQGEMSKRYGTIYVNRDDKDLKDMKRYKKKSFYWYKKVIETNGACLFED